MENPCTDCGQESDYGNPSSNDKDVAVVWDGADDLCESCLCTREKKAKLYTPSKED